ncbi:VOC family protein [Nocardioides marinquilinus]|uniref:VOC family protein n=1 Tax=Nocardioides marinquilinus TaxID=1210400 RepID=A0ABP9Q7A7_9ACTN
MERTFPHGVPSWVDTMQDDVDAALAFYGGLFGWTFTDAMPPDAPDRYVVAALDGRDAAAIGGPREPGAPTPPAWATYVAVDDCDATAERLVGLGARLVSPPEDAGPGGRTATVADPEGVELRLWQARRRLGVQVANEPGAWNFSNLLSADPDAAAAFYGDAFGWDVVDQGWARQIQVPGYGDHLESTVDPDIRTRQAHAPEGFADVVGGIVDLDGAPDAAGPDDPGARWHVTFTVADRDDAVATVERLGGTAVAPYETDWVRACVVRDPQGALFTVSQFAPKEWG